MKVYILTMYLVLSVAIYIVSLGKDWGAGMAAWKGTDGLRKEILEKIPEYRSLYETQSDERENAKVETENRKTVSEHTEERRSDR